ncbi:hypothetical protein VC83_01142 [Pseudogymnoascus destructans]|uniref:DUF7603 domain-containing protein n=2 Tax=Pseudogymnoascus destructans TaxID=655981 RepID=L8GAW7_PSED2|nr:uncharacterized protein VC83_01142 [Pseudogymnoascus destructans]ELR09793.1 hypothetical protein GMDG_04277 [Pseudogymnoascus destructans 20631-21]OAF62694.1 hypothetical protein VC83_01142 [Pseudogymnoascus destructans]
MAPEMTGFCVLASTQTPSPPSRLPTPPPPSPPPHAMARPLPHSDAPSASSPSDVSSSLPSQFQPVQPGPDRQSADTVRPRASSLVSTTSSIKRKPLPLSALPLVARYSVESSASTFDSPSARFLRRLSIDSPTLYDPSVHRFPHFVEEAGPHQGQRISTLDIPQEPFRPLSPVIEASVHQTLPTATPNQPTPAAHTHTHKHSIGGTPPTSSVRHARLRRDSALSTTSSYYTYEDSSPAHRSRSGTMSLFAANPQPPNLGLPDNDARGASFDATSIKSPSDKQLSKSPGASKLGSFFGWGGNTSPASSTTTFSEDKNFSPIPSPTSPAKHFSKSIASRAIPIGTDVPKANSANESFFDEEFAPSSVDSESHVGEMEEELKTISAELATSIRREMELEDLVERLQSEVDNPRGPNKRTSDYFSDSGTSSVKYGGDTDSRTEEIERMQRKTDREKAQIRLDCQEKVQEERTRRSGLEKKIRRLEEKVSHVDLASINSLDSGGRLKDVEATCEDLRRRLNDERKVKENFEDLLTALRGELHTSHNERDNLRDEVIPQLRARVEGLEAQAAEHEKLAYDHTKAQQQMQLTRGDSVRKLQTDIQSHMDSIGEDGPQPNSGLKRSTSVRNSTVTTTPLMRSRPTSMSLAKGVESRDMLLERVKDVEAQRDALHRALKSLLERQEHQTKENDKRLRQLEIERDNALKSAPKRAGYGKDVSSLRDEINTLRRRADEAIEQKWQCEKGLSGLKMDLDRAEQEIGSLRNLLVDKGVAVPENIPGSRSSANSSSLEQAYSELKKTYAASLDRVKALESQVPRDGTTDEALRSLQTSLTTAIADRDSAVSSLHTTELSHLSTETDLASQLQHAAEHIEGLAGQVRAQLSANSTLRARLAETIKRGEVEQNANVARIMGMQGKLRTLEEALMAAQQASEERTARHEDEVRELKETRHSPLIRVKNAIRSPRLFAPKSPMSPLFAGGVRSPRVDVTSGGKAMNVGEESRVGMLKSRVEELERALGEADREMEEVVGRMNVAQIEVMELQNEREEAVAATRMLEKRVEEERLRGFEGRFRSFQT